MPPGDSLQGGRLLDVIPTSSAALRARPSTSPPATTPTGSRLSGDVREALDAARRGKVGDRSSTTPNQPSYNSEADRIATGNPDAFVIFDFPETYRRSVRRSCATGNWEPGQDLRDRRPRLERPARYPRPSDVADGPARDRSGHAAKPARPAQAFDGLFDSRAEAVDRQTFDAQNFDAVVLCYLSAVAPARPTARRWRTRCARSAPRRARSTPGSSFPQAIRALRSGKDIDYEGASGPIDMDAAGDPTAGAYDLFQFKDGAAQLDRAGRGRGRASRPALAEEVVGDPQVVEVDVLHALDLAQRDARHLVPVQRRHAAELALLASSAALTP